MRQLFLISTFLVYLLSIQVNAQFKYDPQKVSSIRWTPMPASVGGLKDFKIDLNGSWQFNAAPEKDFFKKSKPSGWKTIEVPGEWVMQGHTVKSGEYAGYVRSFKIPSEWKGMRIILKCEAIYSECSIWVNKEKATQHLGGFTQFETDITSLVKSGDNNISIAVRSESLADTLSSGSQYAVHPLGGITRPIYLIAVPEVNVASFHVSTKFDKNYQDAVLKSELKIANETTADQKAELKFNLRDAAGKSIAVKSNASGGITLKANTVNSSVIEFNVANPKKWDCEHPNLYFLECVVAVNGKEITKVVRRFGFRQVEVRKNQVFVNNQLIKLKGVCRHEVTPDRGRSLIGNQWAEDVKIFKDGNVNYIRTSHYPPNEKLLEACDEQGMFVEVEAPFCWANKKPINDTNYFEAILQPTLEMVERDKSHPSIIHWSVGNESRDFKELFKVSSDLVKVADPTRPRIFSQWGENSDDGYLELGNHHYPGPTGPDKYRNNKRPVTFDEYCHLNAYNRYELMTDPGLRDFWGDNLLKMWNNMYYSKGVLGGALWAAIDDSFFLPNGPVVGYGTWGPIDGWRRQKPEYWHMKKAFTPVKLILVDGNPKDSVELDLENRFFFSNLNECRLEWKNGNKSGIVRPNIKPSEKGKIKLPINYAALEKLEVNIYHSSEVAVDQYLFDQSKPTLSEINTTLETFKWSTNGSEKIAESSKLKMSISNENIVIRDTRGNEVMNGWPCLMLVELNKTGDTQMTKDTPKYGLFSPTATNRKIQSIELQKQNSSVVIVLRESFLEATGQMVMTIFSDGRIDLTYNYKMLVDANCRQWGMSFTHPETMNVLSWKRKGLWNKYPDNHIGRNEGKAKLFYGHPECGLAGPAVKPTWDYCEDQTKFGSNDFRSTKRNIYNATLQSANASGIKVVSDGLQHLRCWLKDSRVHSLVAEYDNPGAEIYLRVHSVNFDQPLKQGQMISGKINMQLLNAK